MCGQRSRQVCGFFQKTVTMWGNVIQFNTFNPQEVVKGRRILLKIINKGDSINMFTTLNKTISIRLTESDALFL